MENILFSDHRISVLNTNIEIEDTTVIKENYYTTENPKYNLLEGSELDWNNINKISSKDNYDNNDHSQWETVTLEDIKIYELRR